MKGLKSSLLALRLSIFITFLVWTVEKFLNPSHGIKIVEHFFGIPELGAIFIMLFGAAEMILILGFVAGVYKRFTYGGVFLIHGITTLITIPAMVTNPFRSILFFAAWPMLAACYTLFCLREEDTLLTLGTGKNS